MRSPLSLFFSSDAAREVVPSVSDWTSQLRAVFNHRVKFVSVCQSSEPKALTKQKLPAWGGISYSKGIKCCPAGGPSEHAGELCPQPTTIVDPSSELIAGRIKIEV